MPEDVVTASPDIASAWEMLARSEVSEGDVAGAVDVVTRWQQTGAPGLPTGEQVVYQLRHAVQQDGVQGYCNWRLDRLETAQDAGRDVPHAELAAVHPGAGNHDAALEQLGVAWSKPSEVC